MMAQVSSTSTDFDDIFEEMVSDYQWIESHEPNGHEQLRIHRFCTYHKTLLKNLQLNVEDFYCEEKYFQIIQLSKSLREVFQCCRETHTNKPPVFFCLLSYSDFLSKLDAYFQLHNVSLQLSTMMHVVKFYQSCQTYFSETLHHRIV